LRNRATAPLASTPARLGWTFGGWLSGFPAETNPAFRDTEDSRMGDPAKDLRLVHGDREEPAPHDLGQLFRRYCHHVARVGARVLGSSEDLDDLVQDVFLDAHRGLLRQLHPGAIRQWLTTITVRKARRRLQRRRWLRWVGLDEQEVELSSALHDPSASAETRAWYVAIYRILDSVPPDARIAWVLNRVEGQPLEEVAVVCACSRATAHRRIQTAQRALEKGLADVER
jgi:RNA polymerase sigma-70 factor (ECF subfamily)